MNTCFRPFVKSAKEFVNLNSIITAAMLIALHTVMALFLSIQVTTSLRISISFLANVAIGYMFGPVMGFACGGIGDIIQFVIKPTGPYFPGWTISAAIAGLIYGCFFYGKAPVKVQEITEDVATKSKLLIRCLTAVLPVATVIVWALVPFIQVTDKSGEMIFEGTALATVQSMIAGVSIKNVGIVAIILIVAAIALVITTLIGLRKTSLVIAVVCAFSSILAIYTDKKTTTALWGFWAMMIIWLLFTVVQMVLEAKKHSIDIRFMVRCIIALTVDTLLVNVLLGTFWVSVMYGKGFAFYFTTRLVKNLVQLPINIILTYYVLGFLRDIQKHFVK